MNMKKLLLFSVLVMAALLQTGCVKQKQCEMEGGQAGYFIYLQEPFMAKMTFANNSDVEIKAFFVPDASDLNIESLTERLLNDPSPSLNGHRVYYIYGNIPNSFKKNAYTPVKVICSFIETYVNYYGDNRVYMKRISCLERID